LSLGQILKTLSQLEDEYERLMPDFKWMVDRENKLKSAMRTNGTNLGFVQADFDKGQKTE
jgi:hypothetical protein